MQHRISRSSHYDERKFLQTNSLTIENRNQTSNKSHLLELPETISTRELEKKLNQEKNNLSGTSDRLKLAGFHRLFLNGGNRKRDAICSLVAHFPNPVQFVDDFPLTQDELQLRERIKSVFSLVSLESSKNAFSLVQEEAMSVEERSRRAALKKKQIAEFDEKWRTAIKKIVYLKSFQVTERKIAKMLAERGITTRNGKVFTQGGVNRLYHQFVGIYRNMRESDLQVVSQRLQTMSPERDTALPPGPVVDRRKETVQNVYKPLQFEDKIEIRFKPGTYGEDDFFIKFLDRNYEEIEMLFVRKEYVVDGKLTIDVLEHTVLSPGYYLAEFYVSNDGKMAKDSSCVLPLIVGAKHGRIPDIRMTRGLDGQTFFPVYVGSDQSIGN